MNFPTHRDAQNERIATKSGLTYIRMYVSMYVCTSHRRTRRICARGSSGLRLASRRFGGPPCIIADSLNAPMFSAFDQSRTARGAVNVVRVAVVARVLVFARAARSLAIATLRDNPRIYRIYWIDPRAGVVLSRPISTVREEVAHLFFRCCRGAEDEAMDAWMYDVVMSYVPNTGHTLFFSLPFFPPFTLRARDLVALFTRCTRCVASRCAIHILPQAQSFDRISVRLS